MDKLLWAMSIYLVPIAIGLVSVAAIFVWDDQFAGGNSQALPMQVLLESSASLSTRQALDRDRKSVV